MGKYSKPLFIFLVISLFFLVDNVSALSFSSTSVRTAYYYENGQLVDTGFVSTNPRNLPQYGSVQTGSVSLRLYQWRYSTGTALPIGRYKILTDITFSSLDGNSIYNFLSPKFEEIRCGSSSSNASEDNVDLINYEFKYINENKFQFNYTIDVLSNSCSLFSGIFKYEPNSYMSRYDVNTSTTQNETLSYYTSYQELQKTDNQDIIDNQDKNTQDVIDNNNSNTQDIIDNQNKNNEELKDAINDGLNSCRPSVNLINISNFTANASSSSNYIHLGDIYLESGAYTLSWDQLNSMTSNVRNTPQIRFNGTAIALQDVQNNHLNAGHYSFSFTAFQSGTYSIYYWAHSFSTNTSFSKFQLQKGTVATSYEQPGQEICSSKIDDTNDKLDGINGSLNDSNVDSDVGTGFFDDFNNEDFGLSEIITIPLDTITSLTSKSCQPLSIPIPKTGKNINLPCMTQVYEDKAGPIFTIWQVVSFGIIAYFIAIDIFHLVKGFKDPESDKVEVLDL